MNDFVSEVMKSNLFTMGITSKKDPRQAIGLPYTIPGPEVRLLRAKLIYEEAMETIAGLGVVRFDNGEFVVVGEGDLEQIIDGVCDTDYVGVGTLASCGVLFDKIHKEEVCNANNPKLPGGVAIFNASGNFLKPEGWIGPDHMKIQTSLRDSPMYKAAIAVAQGSQWKDTPHSSYPNE